MPGLHAYERFPQVESQLTDERFRGIFSVFGDLAPYSSLHTEQGLRMRSGISTRG